MMFRKPEDCKKELAHYVGKNFKKKTWAQVIEILIRKGFHLDATVTIQEILLAVKQKYKEEYG